MPECVTPGSSASQGGGFDVIADEGWAAPRTTAEAFTRLAEHGVIPAQLAAALKQAVGFRNIIVHGYSGVDLRPLHRAATEGVADLDAFARAVTQWASASPPSSSPI
jgi:uncharacterized protein YutE (UPF0331/DUF86 family)